MSADNIFDAKAEPVTESPFADAVPAADRLPALSDEKSLMGWAEWYSHNEAIPPHFRGKIGPCFQAIEIAQRLKMPVPMVMDGLYPVNGRLAWEGKFLTALSNSSGKFSPIRHKMTGTKGKDDYGCIAYFTEIATGEVIEGPEVTIGMAKGLGWIKNPHWVHGSDYMLRYRASSLLVKTTAPELLCGLQTRQEMEDIVNITPGGPVPATEDTAAEREWRERNESRSQ